MFFGNDNYGNDNNVKLFRGESIAQPRIMTQVSA